VADVMNEVTVSPALLFRLASVPLLGPVASWLAGWTASRALALPAQDLRQALPLLAHATQNLEAQYLELGAALESQAEIAGQVVAGAQQVVGMACGKQTGHADFERAIGVLDGPMQYLRLVFAELPGIASALESAAAETGRLVALQQALERALAPLGITQLMFSVESAGLPEAARDAFSALTRQIGALHERVQNSLRRHSQALAETGRSLREAISALEQYGAQHGAELQRRRDSTAQILARLKQELAENAGRDVKLTSASQALAAEVNRAVTALQTQDMVAQKLDHASRGLAEAIQSVEQTCQSAGAGKLQQVGTVSRIELAQLEHVEAELNRSRDTLSQALDGIEARLAEMDDQCLMLHEFRSITASVDGTAQVLIDSLAALREMTADSLALIRRLEQILRPVEAAAGILTDSVSAVASEIHRIALNAQIQAVQTGQRTGLEVLAEHIAGLARDTLRINAELCSGLSRSVAGTNSGIAGLARLREAGDAALETCDRDGGREVASLHEFRDTILSEMHQVGALLDQARHKIAGMLSGLDLQVALGLIGDVRRRVEHLAACARDMAPPQPAGAASEASGLARRYTMASERQVHRRVIEGLHPTSAHPLPEPASQLGAGIELF
jgi:hypothetical protein